MRNRLVQRLKAELLRHATIRRIPANLREDVLPGQPRVAAYQASQFNRDSFFRLSR